MLVLTFRVAEVPYAVAVRRVVEVVPRVGLAGVPHAPGYLAGLLRCRGGAVPVVDLGLLMGGPACGTGSTRGSSWSTRRPRRAGPGSSAWSPSGSRTSGPSTRRGGRRRPGDRGGPLPRAGLRDRRGLAPADRAGQDPWRIVDLRRSTGRSPMSGPPGVVERLLADRIGLDPSSVGEGLIAGGSTPGWCAWGSARRPTTSGPWLGRATRSRRWSRRWSSRRAGSSGTTGRSRSWRLRPGGLAGRPGPAAAGGPEHPLRRGRGAVLDRDDPAGSRPARRAVPGRRGGRQRPGAGPGDRRGLRPELVPGGGRGRSARRYFREQHGAFTIDPAVRSSVRFHLGQPARPGPVRRPPAVRRGVLPEPADLLRRAGPGAGRSPRSAGSLVDGGLLFLGHADRLDDRRGLAVRAARRRRGASPTGRAGEARPRKRRGLRPSPRERGRARRARHGAGSPAAIAPASTVGERPSPRPSPGGRPEATKAVGRTPGRAARHASTGPGGWPTRGVTTRRRGWSSGPIGEPGRAPGRYFLLGMIRQAAGDRDRAEAHFLKAVYLDAQHDEALLALAMLARRKGDVAAEAGYRRRAERVRSRKGVHEHRAGPSRPGVGDCWNRIGVNGDRTCPELEEHVHCRNCPVFAGAARGFFDRRAPEGYLAEWAELLGRPVETRVGRRRGLAPGLPARARVAGHGALGRRRGHRRSGRSTGSRTGPTGSSRAWSASGASCSSASRCTACSRSTRPTRRRPAGESPAGPDPQGRGALGVPGRGGRRRPAVPRDQLEKVPSTLANPAGSFGRAVFAWGTGRSVNVLDEPRVFEALRSMGA